jgi:hypothetical protein
MAMGDLTIEDCCDKPTVGASFACDFLCVAGQDALPTVATSY